MPDDLNAKVTAHQKNDDNRWYYSIGQAGSRVGPYDTKDEALEAGKQALTAKEDDGNEGTA